MPTAKAAGIISITLMYLMEMNVVTLLKWVYVISVTFVSFYGKARQSLTCQNAEDKKVKHQNGEDKKVSTIDIWNTPHPYT